MDGVCVRECTAKRGCVAPSPPLPSVPKSLAVCVPNRKSPQLSHIDVETVALFLDTDSLHTSVDLAGTRNTRPCNQERTYIEGLCKSIM